ncbi:hypothetical protein HYS28_03325 [Candidatus Uhrbacteria bacterium]|nr:hypothetical protein [Candidatus Uhrbacteria bacterium]MBI4598850.1 hypothetical protein [Candidatus Uhrbacteria bacterium]
MAQGFLQEEDAASKASYGRAVWWIGHRTLLRRALLITWAALDAGLILFAAWAFLDAFVLSYDAEQRAVAEMAVVGQSDLRSFASAHAARPLGLGQAAVFPLGDGRYDFYAPLANPNPEWYAEFRYAFSFPGGETPSQPGFILPGADKPLAFFGHPAPARPPAASLVVRDLVWYRLDPHLISDYATWRDERLAFITEEASFSKDVSLGKDPIPYVRLRIRNAGTYGFWDPVFTILLIRGGSVAGVTRTTLSRFAGGEMRNTSVQWFGTAPAVSKVEVVPDVNLFDPSVYMALEGEATRDARSR